MTGSHAAERAAFDPSAPLVIAGSGGSGTRLVAEIAMRSGVFMGSDLNGSNDNLWFALLLNRPSIRPVGREDEVHAALDLLTKAMTTHDRLTWSERRLVRRAVREKPRPFDRDWLEARARTLAHRPPQDAADHRGWGWKAPNTHVFLDHLVTRYPRMRYVHVLRHGLDMALSGNQNQIKIWHRFFGVPAPPPGGPSPAAALHFWCVANQRALGIAGALGPRFLAVNYDDLCADPEVALPPLVDFLGGDTGSAAIDELRALVDPPGSIGRRAELDLSAFDAADLAVVEAMGFPIG